MPNLTERYLVPGERRVVDAVAADRLRGLAMRAAAEVGMDKVTAAVVLLDLAVELLATNSPPYGPGVAREVAERAIVVHWTGGELMSDKERKTITEILRERVDELEAELSAWECGEEHRELVEAYLCAVDGAAAALEEVARLRDLVLGLLDVVESEHVLAVESLAHSHGYRLDAEVAEGFRVVVDAARRLREEG
ncbi:MAG: hypothetical protein ACYS76_16790 [Planctomycetota bacterium]|jgi:hypothetical protein